MRYTENTEHLLISLQKLDKIDPEKLYASGFDVAFYNYTEERPDHMPRVTILGKDCGPLVEAMRVALLSAIEERRLSLEMQLRSIDRVLAGRVEIGAGVRTQPITPHKGSPDHV